MADEDTDPMTEDVGGVQGSEPGDGDLKPDNPTPEIAADAPEEPVADAGEIEWAGTLVKRPPSPQN